MTQQGVLGGLVAFVLIWGSAVLLRWLARRFLGRHHVRADLIALVSNTIYFGLFAVAVVAGVGFASNNGGLAFNGVLVAALLTGLGLQDLAKNYVSGFYILFERNVRVGDRLDTQGLYRGTVTDVRLRATYLRGDGGELVVIPNNELFTKPIVVSSPGPARPSVERAEQDPAEGVKPVAL